MKNLTCNNLPDSVERLHAGDAHEATAAPLPSSAALQTERAWPGADGRQTSEELDPAVLVDKQLLLESRKAEEIQAELAETIQESPLC